MRFNLIKIIITVIAAFSMTACEISDNHQLIIKNEDLTIPADSVKMNCFIAYSDDTSSKKPIVLIVPEWWGLDTHVKTKANLLAELGYFAVGIDMYGNGKVASDPATAKTYTAPFYTNPQLALGRLQAALTKAKTYSQADTSRTAAIGYCFGGAMVLNSARLGLPVNGVVSFHGNLSGISPVKELFKAQVLICHGAIDQFVPAQEVATFKTQMDSLGIPYTFKEYANATHAFTNPASTENGKKFDLPIAYNEAADTASFNDMRVFFKRIFEK